MVSRILTGAAAVVAALSIAGMASAGSNWSNYSNSYSTPSYSTSSWSSPSYSMSSYEADSTYGTGSISETYSDSNTYSFSGSTASVPGLGYNESLQATNCPVNVHGSGEGTVLGCYNVVKPVPQTTYYRVVRPVIYVRYPVPVAVPYYSPCGTYKISSRYGELPGQRRAKRSSCR